MYPEMLHPPLAQGTIVGSQWPTELSLLLIFRSRREIEIYVAATPTDAYAPGFANSPSAGHKCRSPTVAISDSPPAAPSNETRRGYVTAQAEPALG